MKSTCRMHCHNILEDHLEDCMIVLGCLFSSCIEGTLLLTLISATNSTGHHDCAFVQTSCLYPPCKHNRLHIYLSIHVNRSGINETTRVQKSHCKLCIKLSVSHAKTMIDSNHLSPLLPSE